MRRDLQNKADAADQPDQIINMANACQYCGRPLSDWGCRAVPLGFWCLMAGLQQDPRTIIGPRPDPMKPIIEETREVKKAAAEHERATTEAERLDAKWRAAALAHYRAKQQRHLHSQVVMVDGVPSEWAPPGTPTAGELSQLQAIADEAFLHRQHAAERVIKARQALDAARVRARRKLSRVAA